jgi:hypothetical protein
MTLYVTQQLFTLKPIKTLTQVQQQVMDKLPGFRVSSGRYTSFSHESSQAIVTQPLAPFEHKSRHTG